MAKKTRKKHTYKKIILTIVSILVISFIIFGLYSIGKLIIKPTDVVVVNQGEVYSEESSVGYVLREESLIEENSEKKLIQIKTEGEKVAKGEVVYRYNTPEEDEINKKIQDLTMKIQEALEGQTDLLSSDIKALENQIESKLYRIDKKNNIQNIREYKNDISTYITKKAKIAGSLSKSGTYINSLIEQKEALEEQLALKVEYVYAPVSGVVSYRTDELEQKLTTEDFSYITSEFLENLNLKVGQVVNTSNNKCKIVNNYKCYIATVLESEEAQNIEVNKNVRLRVSNEDIIKAKIIYKQKENDKTVIVFEINKNIEKLIEYRKISIDVIWWEEQGLKIPKNTIYYDDGLAYVVRNRAGYLERILVKVIEKNDFYCIVNNYETEELSKLGLSTEEIARHKNINLYDEIIVNPEINMWK